MAKPQRPIPHVVFYGTCSALIRAADADRAYAAFVERLFPEPTLAGDGRLMPPTREEVAIRPLRADDADWVEQTGDKSWESALREVKVRAR